MTHRILLTSFFPQSLQMEYVEKLTLREAIEDGITEVDAWRLMVGSAPSKPQAALNNISFPTVPDPICHAAFYLP